jgi:hypothetical protein
MVCRCILLALAAASAAMPVQSESVSHITVSSEPATVEVTPQAAGRRLIRLPALEFSLEIEPQCDNDMRAESLSISVADTRQVVAFADDEDIISTTLRLPRQQTAPLAVVDFCRIDEDERQGSQELLVRDAFTAHFSLRCQSDEQQSVIYASQSLDLTLLCKPADQEPSVDSTTR